MYHMTTNLPSGPSPDDLVTAVATLSDKLGLALREFATGLRQSTPASSGDEPAEPAGARQQQVLEIEGLANQEGMKVAEVAKALGGHDVANTHLTLRSLEKKGAVEMVPGKAPQHWRLTKSYAERRRVWEREELVLALDRYVRTASAYSQADIEELQSDLVFWALSQGKRGRSAGSIGYKLANFRAIATDGAEGFPHFGARDQQVYDEFIDHPDELHQEAEAILRRLGKTDEA